LVEADPDRSAERAGLPTGTQERMNTMRFMMMVMANEASESGTLPTADELAEMGRYNEELVKAGVMLSGDGLHPSSKGARITYSGDTRTVVDGPFTEAKELIAGYWVIDVKSKDEAVEWARRVPFREGEVHLRQIFEASDFGEAMTPEHEELNKRLRAEVEEQQRQKQ
jgi:hypothetical protein